MSVDTVPFHPGSGDLDRAVSAERILMHSGLGPMDWLEPVWLNVLGEIDRGALDFVAARVRQDKRLQRHVKACSTSRERRLVQMSAILEGLEDYVLLSGRRTGVCLDFIAQEIRAAASQHGRRLTA